MLDCIGRLGYVQIDTISVINRAHHHTIWARVPGYREEQLDALQRKRKVFEYWSHAAAYLPMEDFRFCLLYMNAISAGQKHWRTPDKKVMKAVLKRIASEGALKARDFEAPNGKRVSADAWGSAKPAKKALEQLFIEGQLMISHRDGFQKVFDLPERILPANLDTSRPTTAEYCRHLIDRTIQSQGIVTAPEIGYLRKGLQSAIGKQIQQMLADKEIVQVRIEGNENVYYSRADIIEHASSTRVASQVHLLSPFDNLVIQRKRMAQLFDFDYQIECYVPAAKRIHGYFCLPILFGDEFVGRLDPKADRRKNQLLIRNLVIEKEITNPDQFIPQLARKLNQFGKFNGCNQTTIERCNLKQIGAELSRIVI